VQIVVVGIAGGSGSGKTTVAEATRAAAGGGVAALAFDSYYRDQAHMTMGERRAVNYDHPDALDAERMCADLQGLRSGAGIASPVYDFAAFTRSDRLELVEPQPIVLVDGILLLWFPELRAQLDLAVYVDVPDQLRIDRRVRRDIDERGRTRAESLARIAHSVQPMHEAFVAPTAAHADLVLDGTAPAHQSARAILAHPLVAGAMGDPADRRAPARTRV
jgi:uridine kinase